MARNHTHIDAPPDDVWAVFEDPYAYPRWVVGTDRTVGADQAWPAVGSEFRVHVALGHVDTTTVVELGPGRRIVLDAASSFLGPARVTLEVEPEGSGSRVTIVEDPEGKLKPLKWLPPVQLAIRLRNVESMRRLRRLTEARSRRGAAGAVG